MAVDSLLEKVDQIVSLCEATEKYNLNFGLVVDCLQSLTAECLDTLKINNDKYMAAIEKIHPYQYLIKGIHKWGKKKNPKGRWITLCGTLEKYFSGNEEVKTIFINGIKRMCEDDRIRFLAP